MIKTNSSPNNEKWSFFIDYYNAELRQIPKIIDHLLIFLEIRTQIKDLKPISYGELINLYKDYIYLLQKLEHPLEKEFFDIGFVPICSRSLDYYYDLNKHQIFAAEFFWLKPHKWYKKYIIGDVNFFMEKSKKESFNIIDYLARMNFGTRILIQGFFTEREEMGLD